MPARHRYTTRLRPTVGQQRIPADAPRLGSQQMANQLTKALAELDVDEATRQGKKHLLELKRATVLVLNSGDKRRRPRGVSRALFKEVRALKLTRTAKIRRKK